LLIIKTKERVIKIEKLKVLSLFSGIGAFEKALERLQIPFDLVGFSEIDKYAIKSYCAIHNVNESLNLGDVSKIDENNIPACDLMTWGFPCQDISVAGKQKGVVQGETRSGLYYEGLRILKVKKPKYTIIENVKALTQTKFKDTFEQILKDLNNAGYNTYWEILNAKHYDIPQDRDRLFIVGIRKDLIQTFAFDNNKSITQKSIENILDTNISEDLYIKNLNNAYDEILINYKKQINVKNKIIKLGNIYPKHGQNGNIYSIIGLSPTLRSGQGIVGNGIGSNNAPKIFTKDKRIRKMSALECWRLMGFSDEDFNKAQKIGISNTQLYKQAGNSIVVNVVESIMKNLLYRYIQYADIS
jgi:DNA (cytosine-5)-methyltransferase 1